MEGRITIPEFLTKTYEMVDNQSTDHLVSWSPSGTSFVIWRKVDFTEHLLPLIFNHNNFSSFNRQLNKYGFSKINKYRWEFANRNFLRGQPELMQNMRMRPTASNLPLTELVHLRDEVERLKEEKRSLLFEVEKLEEENESYEREIQSLKTNPESTVKGIESERNPKKRKCVSTNNFSGKKANIFEDILKGKAKLVEIDLNSPPVTDVAEDPVDPPSTGVQGSISNAPLN